MRASVDADVRRKPWVRRQRQSIAHSVPLRQRRVSSFSFLVGEVEDDRLGCRKGGECGCCLREASSRPPSAASRLSLQKVDGRRHDRGRFEEEQNRAARIIPRKRQHLNGFLTGLEGRTLTELPGRPAEKPTSQVHFPQTARIPTLAVLRTNTWSANLPTKGRREQSVSEYRIPSNERRKSPRLFSPLRASRRHRLSSEDLLSNTTSTAPNPSVELPPELATEFSPALRHHCRPEPFGSK